MKRIVVLLMFALMLAGCTTLESAAPTEDSPAEPRATTASTTAEPETTKRAGGGTASEAVSAIEDAASGLRVVTIETSGGDEVRVRVEIADDDFERARGLMYRETLAERRGMLFVFPDEQTRSFWMKNTRIPLSIAFMDSEGRIVDIQDLEPLDETSRRSAKPAQYALEVNQGFFEERGVEVGDRAELPE